MVGDLFGREVSICPSVVKLAVKLLDILGSESRAEACILQRLKIGCPVCAVPFELDDYQISHPFECQYVKSVIGVLKAGVLRSDE